MKTLVTGGAGFIGSHITDALINADYETHILDDLSTGKKENINPKAIFHHADIRSYKEIEPIFSGVDYVFHLAALPRVVPSIQDPQTSHDINVNGTLNVLLAAKNNKAKRVVFSSSSSVYGNADKLPFHEDMPANPMSPYALQKYFGERMCRLFSEIYELETVVLRYVNVYGPRYPKEGPYALVIGKFLEQRKIGGPLTIVPDGKQSRDFVHAYDVARANILAAESQKAGFGEIINIAGGRNYSVLEIADLIGGPKVFIEPRLEVKHTLEDISKARELLGWKPEVSFDEGISQLKKLSGLGVGS